MYGTQIIAWLLKHFYFFTLSYPSQGLGGGGASTFVWYGNVSDSSPVMSPKELGESVMPRLPSVVYRDLAVGQLVLTKRVINPLKQEVKWSNNRLEYPLSMVRYKGWTFWRKIKSSHPERVKVSHRPQASQTLYKRDTKENLITY